MKPPKRFPSISIDEVKRIRDETTAVAASHLKEALELYQKLGIKDPRYLGMCFLLNQMIAEHDRLQLEGTMQ